MAGQFIPLTRAALSIGAALLISSIPATAGRCKECDAKTDEANPQSEKKDEKGEKSGKGKMSPEFNNVRRAMDALTPEQRQHFIENLQRWANLSPADKKALADRDSIRKKKMAEDIENAIRDSGLTLEGERRTLFAKRYSEERRKIEEQLRREMDETRKPLVKGIVEQLKTEFATVDPAPR